MDEFQIVCSGNILPDRTPAVFVLDFFELQEWFISYSMFNVVTSSSDMTKSWRPQSQHNNAHRSGYKDRLLPCICPRSSAPSCRNRCWRDGDSFAKFVSLGLFLLNRLCVVVTQKYFFSLEMAINSIPIWNFMFAETITWCNKSEIIFVSLVMARMKQHLLRIILFF